MSLQTMGVSQEPETLSLKDYVNFDGYLQWPALVP